VLHSRVGSRPYRKLIIVGWKDLLETKTLVYHKPYEIIVNLYIEDTFDHGSKNRGVNVRKLFFSSLMTQTNKLVYFFLVRLCSLDLRARTGDLLPFGRLPPDLIKSETRLKC